MGNYLITAVLIFCLMVLAIGVERLYKRFQARNPHLGPFRKLDGQCTCRCNHCGEGTCGH